MPKQFDRVKLLQTIGSMVCIVVSLVCSVRAQDARNLTPLQLDIEKQKQRLSSSEIEERRDALMHLGRLRRPEASRVAVSALTDLAPIIRATAASAVVSLTSDEAAGALLPLLADKDEFVRQQVAYALGSTRSRSAVTRLLERLNLDKMDSVRAASVVALGQIADESAVVPLVTTLTGAASGGKKQKREKNEFILRAAARSLGQIRSRVAVPALIDALGNEALPMDVRRESAHSLGLIGDATALPALRAASSNADVYLSQMAREAINRIGSRS